MKCTYTTDGVHMCLHKKLVWVVVKRIINGRIEGVVRILQDVVPSTLPTALESIIRFTGNTFIFYVILITLCVIQ